MKKTFFWLFAFVVLVCATFTTSCSGGDDLNVNTENPVRTDYSKETVAHVTKETRDDKAKATILNIEYPSLDPYGKAVTLSGVIIIGDEVKNDSHRRARGMVLYNHYTVFEENQCPSKGDVNIPMKVVGSKMFAVAADYYGFGVTNDKNQAYCIASANAQASVDALLAAREILDAWGYSWDDYLFNIGYSEGAQTAIGVLRLCAEKYPEIQFTHTVAGDGPYDIGETYSQLLATGTTSMPASVANTLLAYDEYCNLGIAREDMFKEPALSKIDDYLLSKKYTSGQLDGVLSSGNSISDFTTPAMIDLESDIAKKFMGAFSQENLTAGWTPRGNERISLIHNNYDDVVPVQNVTNLVNFLQGKNFEITYGNIDKYNEGTVYVQTGNWTPIFGVTGYHNTGAVYFLQETVSVICHYLNIGQWFSLTELTL